MFRLSQLSLESLNLQSELTTSGSGGLCLFEGVVRNNHLGRAVVALEYETHPPLCQSEADQILKEAKTTFEFIDAVCVHRVGTLAVGELAVWVGVSAAHRDAAFRACRYIIDELKKRLPIWKKEHYIDGTSAWIGAGSNHPIEIQQSIVQPQQFYSRQMILPEIGMAGQKRLADAKVLVVGAGGLGSSAILALAGAGVGTIGICDGDRLEESNLHRQMIYNHADIGQLKAELAAKRITALNPSLKVIVYPEHLTSDNVATHLASFDVVLDCTDNFAAKFLLNDSCYLYHKVLIQASIYRYEGQLRVMRPKGNEKGCLRCLWPKAPQDGCVGTCTDAGVLGIVPAFFGNLQAWEAIRVILGFSGLSNETLIMDLKTYDQRLIQNVSDPSCPVCGIHPTVLSNETPFLPSDDPEMTMEDVERRGINQFVFIDVREEMETLLDPITGIQAENLPCSQFEAQWRSVVHPDRTYVFVCAKGIRSFNVTQYLRQEGFKHTYSLAGGVDSIRNWDIQRINHG